MNIEPIPSEIIAAEEFTADQFISGEHSLKRALTNIGANRAMKNVWFGSPELQTICTRLARLLSHCYPMTSGDRLLDVALQDALRAYDQSCERNAQFHEHDDAFVAALIGRSSEMSEFVAHAVLPNGETRMWPAFDLPLVDWVKKVAPTKLMFTRPAAPREDTLAAATRMMLATTVVGFKRSDMLCMAAGLPPPSQVVASRGVR